MRCLAKPDYPCDVANNLRTVDGLRIDTVKHVQKSFWPGYNTAAGVYCVGEVFSGDPAYTCPYQSYLDGVLNYPMYVSRCFKGAFANQVQLLPIVVRIRVNKWQHHQSLQHDQLRCV